MSTTFDEAATLYKAAQDTWRSNRESAITVRQPLGVAGLIIAANTPIANVAWKVFPALLCGNAAVLKPAEDTPLSAWAFGVLARAVGLPPSVLQIVHGLGEEAGAALVESPAVDVVSFTGSCEVGRAIAARAGRFGAAKVLLKPASAGTGVIAGGSVRAVVESAGIENILTKCLGSRNPHNLIKATINGLRQLKTPDEISGKRGKAVAEIL